MFRPLRTAVSLYSYYSCACAMQCSQLLVSAVGALSCRLGRRAELLNNNKPAWGGWKVYYSS